VLSAGPTRDHHRSNPTMFARFVVRTPGRMTNMLTGNKPDTDTNTVYGAGLAAAAPGSRNGLRCHDAQPYSAYDRYTQDNDQQAGRHGHVPICRAAPGGGIDLGVAGPERIVDHPDL
jgi:hypothetical protein